MNAIILTGGISTGKSSVVALLSLLGYKIIDADKIAHNLLESNSLKIKDLLELDSSFLEDNKIKREKLGVLIFNDASLKKRLESFLHPLIHKEILSLAYELEKHNKLYFIDIPLYFESTLKYPHKYIVCVYCDKQTQLLRLMKRDNITKDYALKKIDSQLDIEIKRQKSHFVLLNTKDLKALQVALDELLIKLNLKAC